MTIYLCKDDFAGILCGVYQAWMNGEGHHCVRLELANDYEYEMFHNYHEVEFRQQQFEKVATAIQQKISMAVYEQIYTVSLSCKKEKADWIYRYLIYGFQYRAKVIDMLQLPVVHSIFELSRAIAHEAHLLLGFVRFSEIREGALVSVIAPKNDVLALIADHFAERLSGEDWLIFDQQRCKAVVHPKNQMWFVMQMERERWHEIKKRVDEKEYQDLWQIFFTTITITERLNPRCQNTHLAQRFRPYMDEFQR